MEGGVEYGRGGFVLLEDGAGGGGGLVVCGEGGGCLARLASV